MVKVLVTGGLGHVGSAVVRVLLDAGHQIAIVDDGRTSVIEGSGWEVHRASIESKSTRAFLENFRPDAVVHLAASARVGEGERRPLDYAENNIGAFAIFLRGMISAGCRRIIHSGSAAVYGTLSRNPVDEAHSTIPVSWYGWTKLAAEKAVAALMSAEGVAYLAFRYFNVAGCIEGAKERVDVEARLIPRAVSAAIDGSAIVIHGVDYPTRDGTCIRDYVHAMDVAEAHTVGLDWLIKRPEPGGEVVNLGAGIGRTVKEVVRAVELTVGRPVITRAAPRRPGDVAEAVADISKAARLLNWTPRRNLQEAVESTWKSFVRA